jgi:hypothetical protein
MTSHADPDPADAVDAALERAIAAFDEQNYGRAGELYAAVAPLLEDWAAKAIWFDAALCYLLLRDWPRARDLGSEAVRFVERGKGEPAYWNLGTAATALRDWDLARDAWEGFGMAPLPGNGPIDIDGGPTCIRLTVGEVVWATRIDPVRARVRSVPFDPSRRFGEIVLHGGAPNGERLVGEDTYPVFDEIELFEPSEVATLSVLVTAARPDDLETLEKAFHEQGYGLEILASRVNLCSCCSQSSIRRERGIFDGDQQLFLGAPEPDARSLLDSWVHQDPDARSWANLHLAQTTAAS